MCMGMLASGVPQAERPHFMCFCLLARICERVSTCHKWPGHCVASLSELIPEYLRTFRSLYGASAMVHKFAASQHRPLQTRRSHAWHRVEVARVDVATLVPTSVFATRDKGRASLQRLEKSYYMFEFCCDQQGGFHMLQHLPGHIAKHGHLGCFTMERKHKSAKQYMNSFHRVNEGWDRSILEAVLEKSFWSLADTSFLRSGLVAGSCSELRRTSPFYNQLGLHPGSVVHHGSKCRLQGGELVGAGDVIIYRLSDVYSCAKAQHFFDIAWCGFTVTIMMAAALEFTSIDAFDRRVSKHRYADGSSMYVDVGAIHVVASTWLETDSGVRVVCPAWLSTGDGFAFH